MSSTSSSAEPTGSGTAPDRAPLEPATLIVVDADAYL